jgi:RNA 2',3'-cyclic 3'-phosphodiesterase
MNPDGETVRLFIAIPACSQVIDATENLKKINSHLTGIRWVQPENLHLTVLFIGEVNPIYVSFILSAMKAVCDKFLPFTLSFESFTHEGGRHLHPSMVWARFERNIHYSELVQMIREQLHPVLQLNTAFKDPVPHITLARIRSGKLPSLNVPFHCTIEFRELELLRTIRTKIGVTYSTIGRAYVKV